jgi:hypothetical protein
MEVGEAKWPRPIEEKNATLKRVLDDTILDVSMLKEMLRKTSEAGMKDECPDLGREGERRLMRPCGYYTRSWSANVGRAFI